MFNRKFLSISISSDEIKLGLFYIKNDTLYVLDLQTFHSKDELRKYLKTKKLENLNVVGSLGGVHVIARSITFSSVGKINLEREILANIREHIPTFVKDENVLIKYQIISTRYEQVKETVDVLVAIAKENAVIDYIEYLRELNLFPSHVDAGNTSLFLPFVEMYERNISTAIVNIRVKSTDVVIVQNGFPYFVSEFDMGEKEFFNSKSVFHQRLKSVFNFYHSGNSGRKDIKKIIMTGRCDEKIKTYLEKKFDFPVEIADFGKNPLIRFKSKFKDIPSYAHVIGLGLKMTFPALYKMDIIPENEKKNIKFNILKRKLRKLSFSLLYFLSFVTLILLCTNLFYSLRLSVYERRVKGLRTKLEKVYELKGRNRTLREKFSSIEPLIKDETVWDKVLFEISKLTPNKVWLESIKSNSILKKGDNKSIIKEQVLYIEGKAMEQSKIDYFLSRLEDSPLFKSVQIDKIEKKENFSFKLKLILK